MALQFVQAKCLSNYVLRKLPTSFSVSPLSAHSLPIEDAAALPPSHASQTGPRWILANKRLQAKDTKNGLEKVKQMKVELMSRCIWALEFASITQELGSHRDKIMSLFMF